MHGQYYYGRSYHIFYVCITLLFFGLLGIVYYHRHLNDNVYCTKLDNCTYTMAYVKDCSCRRCVISIPSSDCSYYMPEEICPNTTICYVHTGHSCAYPNTNSDFCKSVITFISLVVSIIMFICGMIALFVIIFISWWRRRRNNIEYSKLMDTSTGVMVIN